MNGLHTPELPDNWQLAKQGQPLERIAPIRGVVRDDARLHLSSFAEDGVPGSHVLLVVDDVDAVYRECLQNGVAIELSPTDQTWGNREMYVRDADRNKIAFVRPGPE